MEFTNKESIYKNKVGTMGEKKKFLDRVMETLWPEGSTHEMKLTLGMSWALIITQIADLLFQPVAVMFGGHLGKIELDAISLANMLINVTGLSLITGLVSACETVFSQAFGHGNPRMVGIYLQRGMFIFALTLLLCLSIHVNIEAILLLAAQDPEVSRLCGQYLLYFMPSMFAITLTILLRRYTQCQGSVVPHLIIMLIGHLIHTVCQYSFIYVFNLSIFGSVMAQNAVYIFMAIATLIYTLCSQVHQRAWGGWSRKALEEWGPLTKLGIFGILMTCFEWCAFECTAIVAGLLGVTEQAAQGILINLNNMFYGVPYGFAVAACIRVGQHVGANQPDRARVAAHVGLVLSLCGTTLIVIICGSLSSEIPKLFTSDYDVMTMTTEAMPVFCLFVFFSGVNIIGRGVMRGIGWQFWGALLSFIGFGLLCWPVSIPLVFLTAMGIAGFWYGMAVSVAILSVVYIVLLYYKIDYEQLCQESLQQAYEEKKEEGLQTPVRLPVDERTALLHQSVTLAGAMTASGAHTFSLSHSLTVAATKEIYTNGIDNRYVMEDNRSGKLSKTLLLKRILTCSLFVLIFVLALIIRLVTDVSKSDSHSTALPTAVTDIANSTVIPIFEAVSSELFGNSSLSWYYSHLVGSYELKLKN